MESPSAAEVEARLRLQRLARRARLLKEAKGWRGLRLAMSIVILAATALAAFSRQAIPPYLLVLWFSLVLLAQDQALATRINSLVSLLEDEGHLRPESTCQPS